jgi:hypothetical protein
MVLSCRIATLSCLLTWHFNHPAHFLSNYILLYNKRINAQDQYGRSYQEITNPKFKEESLCIMPKACSKSNKRREMVFSKFLLPPFFLYTIHPKKEETGRTITLFSSIPIMIFQHSWANILTHMVTFKLSKVKF